MILLKAINEILELLTTSTAGIDYSIAYVDITTSTFLPSTTEGTIVTATTSTILPAPAASTQRQVKLITFRNKNIVNSNTITVKKDIAGTEYLITSDYVLGPGEILQYTDGVGWDCYDKNGNKKTTSLITSGYNGRSIGFFKTSTGSDAVSYWYCTSKDAGYPGAWNPNTPGLAGRNTDGTNVTDGGCIPYQNPLSGNMYLDSTSIVSTVPHYHLFFDCLWVNSGIVVATTTVQAINSIALPSRDINGSSNGEGLMIGLLVTAATTNAAAIANTTISYTNSDNVSGRTATLQNNPGNMIPATAVAGTIVWFNLAPGDRGVRSIQTITLGTSLVTGTVNLLIARPIQGIAGIAANIGQTIQQGVPGIRLYNGTCLLHCYLSSAVTVTGISGEIVLIEK